MPVPFLGLRSDEVADLHLLERGAEGLRQACMIRPQRATEGMDRMAGAGHPVLLEQHVRPEQRPQPHPRHVEVVLRITVFGLHEGCVHV